MSIKKRDTSSNQDRGYATDVFKGLNSKQTGKTKSKMIQRTIKLHPEEKEELQSLFDELGLEFNSGVRFALREFKRNHLKKDSAI